MLIPARFSIDSFGSGESVEGFTTGDTWNGWDCPYFTVEQGQLVVEALNRAEEQSALDSLIGFYDEPRDAFVFHYRAQSNSEAPEEDWDIFPSQFIEGQKLYPIGASCWIWEREGKWDSSELSKDAA